MTIEESPTPASASSQAATLVDIMQRRRSVRQFQSGPPVSRETWRTIAQAARWAPHRRQTASAGIWSSSMIPQFARR